MAARHYILGVPVDDVTEHQAVDIIGDFVAQRTPQQVVTLNPEFVMSAQQDRQVHRVLNGAALSTADGTGILWAAKLGGFPLRERVTGVALVERIAARAATTGWRLFLLGSAPGVAERAGRVLQRRYPGLQIAGAYAGTPTLADESIIAHQLADTATDILLVAYGHPNQELWIARNQARLGIPVAIGVGGTFDELTGTVPAAPAWMHRFGVKWLWRLLTQPSRYHRIFTAVVRFPVAVLVDRIRTRVGR